MEKDFVLAYDLGTGGIKASLYDAEGAVVASRFAAYPTYFPGPSMREQKPEDWWRATVDSTRALLAAAPAGTEGAVRAIGISGHSLGVVPLDAEGRLLRAATPIWSDARAADEPEFFFRHFSERAWYMTTGCGFPAPLYSVFKLMWLRRHEPDLFKRIRWSIGTKDYVNFRLTGVVATDNSYATGTGVYSLVTRGYSDRLLEASGLPPEIFPEIRPATAILGTLTAAAARELGLPRTVRVAAGGVDNSCMALGAGAWREGRAYSSLGSSAWIAVSSEHPVLDAVTRPYVFDHVVPGQYASALAIFSSGTSYNWVRDNLCRDLLAKDRENVYQLMEEEAAAAPVGSHGVLFNPSLAGGSSLDPTPVLRGAYLGLDLAQTRGDLVRASMEGVALGLRVALEELRRLAPVVPPLVLVGGGANSALQRRIYADVYGITVARTAIGQQAAALGAAAVAGVGSGLWKDFSIVDAAGGRVVDREDPDPAHVKAYNQLFARFGAATQALGALASPLAAKTLHQTRVRAARPVLTRRQQEILVSVARGLSNQEIALQFGITLNGVKMHLRPIYAKLGVSSRTEAVAAARAARLIPSGN